MRSKVLRRGAVAVAIAMGAVPLTTLVAGAIGSPPSPPQNLSLTSGNRQLLAKWTESTSGVLLYVATAKAPGHPTRKCLTKELTCTIRSLINGVSYDVTVVASDLAGKSQPSSDVVSVPGIPSAPNSVHGYAKTGGGAVTFWAPPTSSGASAITGYTATASVGGEVCSTTGTARKCTITGLTAGTTYSITVVATNKYGSGPASKAFTVRAK